MSTNLEPSSTLQLPKRPRYRLHRFTWCVIFLAAVLLSLAIIPGEYADFWYDVTNEDSTVDYGHGWPWRYAQRTILDSKVDYSIEYHGWSKPPWLFTEAWNFSGECKYFSFANLFLDMLVATAILTLLAGFFEWYFRRGLKRWQFTLRELCGLIIFVAVILSWWATHHQQCIKESEIERKISGIDSRQFVRTYKGPLILHKLLHADNIKSWTDFRKITIFRTYPIDMTVDDIRKALPRASAY